jgi:hypothetical protein
MRYGPMLIAVVAAVFVGGCTSVGDTSATAPSTTAPTITATTTSAITTTTGVITTTTIDRLTEITAIFEDLERRRLQAIYDQDEEAFRALYANAEYLALDVEAIGRVDVLDSGAVSVSNVHVIGFTDDCIALDAEVDNSKAISGGTSGRTTIVLESVGDGWGYSWIGDGWACDGSHPLAG